jgi:autotransporter-associated beta strand protein
MKNNITKIAFIGIFIVSGLLFSQEAKAAIRTASVTGNWNNTVTWGGDAVPTSADDVTINAGVNVTVNVAAACGSITINGTGTITGAATTLTVSGTTGSISGAGIISANTAGTTLTINFTGDWLFTGTFTGTAANLTISPNGTTDQTMGAGANLFCRVFTLNKVSGKFLPNGRTLTISTTMTLTAGTLVVDAATFAGNYATVTPSAPLAGVTIQYTNNNPTILGGINWQNITFSGTGTAGASTSLTIRGNLSNTGGGTLNFGANNVTLDGTVTASIAPFTTNGTLAISNTVGIVTLTGNTTAAGAVTISGTSGTKTLSGSNTFTSGVTFTQGTLNINNNNALGAGIFTISGGSAKTIDNTSGGAITILNAINWQSDFTFTGTNNLIQQTGAVTMNGNYSVIVTGGSLTIGGAIGGGLTRALTKDGNGTLILSGANTIAGTTLVSAGTLQYGADNVIATGAVTVDGGTLDIAGYSDTVGVVTLTSGTITGTTGTLTGTSYAVQSGTVSAILGGAVAMIKSGSGAVTLSRANTFTGGVTLNAGTLNINNNGALGPGTLTISGGTIDNTSGGDITISNVIAWNANFSFTGTNNLIQQTGAVTMNNDRIVTVNGGNLTINGIIGPASAYNLTKAGGGTLILGGANIYTGTTIISAGTLQYGASNVISTGGITISGGILDIGIYTDTVGTVTLASGTITGTSGVLTSTVDYDVRSGTISAILAGAVGLTKTTTGTVTITSANTYTGTTTVSNGVLNIRNNSALGTTDSGTTVNSGEVLELQGNITVTGELLSIAGTGASAGGALRNISGNNTWTGTITLTGNTRINSDSNTLTLPAINSGIAYNLTVGGAGNTTISGAITTLTGTLDKDGSGTLILSGANTYTGTTTISAGTLQYGASNVISTGDVRVSAAGATLDLAGYSDNIGALTVTDGNVTTGGGDLTLTGTLSMNGGSIATGSGTLVLNDDVTSSSSVTGATISGKLDIGSAIRTFISNGSAVDDMSIPAVIIGTGTLTKTGLGALTLSGANTFSGGVTWSGSNIGTININNASALGTGTFTIKNNAKINNTSGAAITLTTDNAQVWNGDFIFTGTNDLNLGTGAVAMTADVTITVNGGNLTVGGVISGAQNLIKSGVGTLTLSGASTYTGSTAINAGILSVSIMADGGVASSIGASNNTATNLKLLGGTLKYTGGTASTDRLFTLGTPNFTIDSSGTGTLTFTNTGSMSTSGTGVRTLILAGSNSGNLASVIKDQSGNATSLVKNDTGAWTLSGANTYTGGTTVNAGTLNVNNASALSTGTLSASATGNTVNYMLAGDQNIKTATYYNLTVSGSGTKTLTGATAVNGALTISAGTLDVSASNYGLAVAGDWVNNGAFTARTGTVAFNGTGAQSISGANTFYGLAITGGNRTVSFQSGVAQSIADNGSLTFTGTVGQLLTLAPLTGASAWQLHVSTTGVTQSVSYVSASYSNAAGYATINASDGTNINGGHNTNWNFGGALTVDIVDAGGTPVGSPTIAMGSVIFSFIYQTASGTFGVSDQKIRVENTTTNPQWSLTMAADSGPTAFWNSAGTDYDFNDPTASAEDGADPDSLGGQMTVNPLSATITPQGGCDTTGLTLGSSASYSESATDDITILSAGASAGTSCYWDTTGIAVSQTIPKEQPAASDYYINMTLTITAI